jgi:UDP-glucuronate decarboxylase
MIDGLLKLMESPDAFVGPVNLGNPTEFTMLELAEVTLRKTQSRSKIVHMPLPQDDPRQRKPDISLARKELSWEPRVTLDDGLDRTIQYFRGVV